MSYGKLASESGLQLPVRVLKSKAGYYLGTENDEGPVSRESVEYWPGKERAQTALTEGNWVQHQL